MTEVASPTRKVFVGIKVPLSLARLLTDFRRTRLIDDESIRWSDPNDLHITLKFIGAIATTTITQIIGKLRNIHSPRFEASLAGADVFQDAGVLVVDIHNAPELLSLQATIAEVLSIGGELSNDRAYRAHVTLARWSTTTTSQPGNHDLMRIRLDEYCKALSAQSFVVEEIILYETASAHYRVLEEFKLDG